MSANWTLRPFEPADCAAAVAFWRGTPGMGLSSADREADLHRFLARNAGLSWLVEEDGQVTATVLCGHDGRRGFIYHLAVAPALRLQGVGRTLTERALASLAGEGIEKCHLMVFADNEVGLGFWPAAGAVLRDDIVVFSLPTPAAS